MEAGSGNGCNRRPELAPVSGAMPYEPGQLPFDARVCARARPSVRLTFPVVAAVGASFCDGVKRRWRAKHHETMREPMERRQGGGHDWRPELATVSGAVPNPPRLRRRVLGRFCARVGSCPGPRARLTIWLSFPMVAAVGSGVLTGRGRNSASRRIHDRTRGACAVPIGHRRLGQHADSHLSLHGNPVFRAHPQRCVYVRG
jgi:hypothetical protein